MKKIKYNEMQLLNGGILKCGTVALLTALTYSTIIGGVIGHYSGLNDHISRCWNDG